MGRFKKFTPILLTQVEVDDVAAEGKCVSRIDGKVLFTDYTAPGDLIDVSVHRSKNKFMEGKAVHFHRLSPLRVEPFCVHFGTCGGCKWQHLGIDSQRQFKQQQVVDALTRLGKIDLPAISPILGSEKTRYYRNKLEFTFSNRTWLSKEEIASGVPFDRQGLGFHMSGSFDKILDLQECHLQTTRTDQIRLSIKAFALKHHYSFFDIKAQIGLLRTLMFRTSSTGDLMVLVQFYEPDMERIEALMEYLKETFPEISSLLYVINPKKNDTFQDQTVITYHGEDHITETMEGLRFKIGPKSFYQTNAEQAYVLYQRTRELAQIQPHHIVYDLYTGTGTIAQFVAKQALKVIGVEYVEAAIADAKANALLNGMENCHFFAGDMKDVLNPAFVAEHGQPDVIIVDPPRNGMHESVIQTLLEIKAPLIVYVSCNPATQARDLQLLDRLYKVDAVQPVDMFPQTHHVENVVRLQLR